MTKPVTPTVLNWADPPSGARTQGSHLGGGPMWFPGGASGQTAVCCSFCAAHKPMHVCTHTHRHNSPPVCPGTEDSPPEPRTFLDNLKWPTSNGIDPQGLLCPAQEDSCPVWPSRAVQLWGWGDGRASRLCSLSATIQRAHSCFKGQVC